MIQLVILTALIFGIVPGVQAGQKTERLSPYSGSELKGEILLCTSDQVAAGGYWYESKTKVTEQGATIGKESRVTTWRITLRKTTADVIRFSGTSQTIEEPEVYSLEVTATGGWLLVWQNRPPGSSPQVITIDPSNSSFVYSTQFVDLMLFRSNRANIFYGTCRPYA